MFFTLAKIVKTALPHPDTILSMTQQSLTKEEYQQRILAVLLYIQHNLDADLTTHAIAERSCFSPYHFHRIFSSIVGETLQAYIRRCRLQRSLQQLTYADSTILEVALAAHYNTHESFTRAFTKQFGFTPSTLRNTLKNNPNTRLSIQFTEGQPSLSHTILLQKESTLEVTIKNLDAMPVAYIRHTGSYFEIGPAWQKLTAVLASKNLLNANTQAIGIYYDNPDTTETCKLRSDACISVPEHFEPFDEIGFQTIPAGKYAMTIHHGPYEGLANIYRELYGSWLPNSGEMPSDRPCFERYVNSPQDTAPENLITEIYLPLK